MNKDLNQYFLKLKQLQENAYCIYSHFPVACIVIDENDQQFFGVNVENCAYGLCMCAERNAIGAMVCSGSKNIKAIHILCGNKEDDVTFASACGACRQVIGEFISEQGIIYVWNNQAQYKTYNIQQYLLDGFNNNKLMKGIEK